MLIVGRFLALLELYRDAMVAFEQITPLGDLTIRWTGPDEGEITGIDEFEGTAILESPAAEVGDRGEDVTDARDAGAEPFEDSDEFEISNTVTEEMNRQQGSTNE